MSSTTTGITSLFQRVAQTSASLTEFRRTYREAGDELKEISWELSQLGQVLGWMREYSKDASTSLIPDALQTQITAVVENCTQVIAKIDSAIDIKADQEEDSSAIQDSIEDVVDLGDALAAHRGALSATVEIISIIVAKSHEQGSEFPQEAGPSAKVNPEKALDMIEKLQSQLSNSAIKQSNTSFLIGRYLERLQDYTEKVCGVVDEDDGFTSSTRPSPAGDSIATSGSKASTPRSPGGSGAPRSSIFESSHDPAEPSLDLSEDEKEAYLELYKQVDPRNRGIVKTEEAVKLWACAGQSRQIVNLIHSIVRQGRSDLTPVQFAMSLRLLAHAQAGYVPSFELAFKRSPVPRFYKTTGPYLSSRPGDGSHEDDASSLSSRGRSSAPTTPEDMRSQAGGQAGSGAPVKMEPLE